MKNKPKTYWIAKRPNGDFSRIISHLIESAEYLTKTCVGRSWKEKGWKIVKVKLVEIGKC